MRKSNPKLILVAILLISPFIGLLIAIVAFSFFYREYQLLMGSVKNLLPGIPSWVWIILTIIIVAIVLWKLRAFIFPKIQKVLKWRPSIPKKASGWLWKTVKLLALIVVLYFGVQLWKEPTLVTSFFKNTFQRKKITTDQWFGVSSGEKYSVVIGRNTLGVWPMIKGDDTVTVTVRNSEGTESYRIWNASHYGRIGADRLTPSLAPSAGVFTFIFNKDVEVKLSTMPPE